MNKTLRISKVAVLAAVVIFGSMLLLPSTLLAGEQPEVDLSELSLEELMKIEVTTVSKRAENISDAAAAVFVLTADDIRRSGATSVPEALHMVPGMEVARMSANMFGVTSRSFNRTFANKLLVLLDMIVESDFDGLDTYKAPLQINPTQRAVVVSGFSATHRVEELLDLGASGYLRKPYTVESVSAAVRAALDSTVVQPNKANEQERETRSLATAREL